MCLGPCDCLPCDGIVLTAVGDTHTNQTISARIIPCFRHGVCFGHHEAIGLLIPHRSFLPSLLASFLAFFHASVARCLFLKKKHFCCVLPAHKSSLRDLLNKQSFFSNEPFLLGLSYYFKGSQSFLVGNGVSAFMEIMRESGDDRIMMA